MRKEGAVCWFSDWMAAWNKSRFPPFTTRLIPKRTIKFYIFSRIPIIAANNKNRLFVDK